MEPLRNHQERDVTAVFFRRTTAQIRNPGGLWDESQKIYGPLGALPLSGALEWRFPSGARVRFAHLEYDKTIYEWQGAQVPLICFDELSDFIEGKITGGQALTETEQWFAGLVKQLAGGPAVQAAVSTLQSDADAAVNVAAQWAGTALDGALSTLAADISAAVAKYGAAVGAGGQVSAAVATAIQAGVAVGVAAVQHGVTSIAAAAPVAPAAPAAPSASSAP
jgi:hypothetical protein